MFKIHNPATIAPPTGRYQHAIAVPPGARWLYISGQVGNLPDGSIAVGIGPQADAVWANLKAVLADAGMGFEDLVKINVLLTDARFVPASREARDRALGSAMPPTSTLSVVTALASPDFLIEIEAIAAKV